MAGYRQDGTPAVTAGQAETLRWYALAVYGAAEGWTFVGWGTPTAGANGKIEHPDFDDRTFRYPAQLDEMVAFAAAMSGRFDVWFTPGLSYNPTRLLKTRRSLPSARLWADLDGAGADDLERADRLAARGGFLVDSGRGRGHVHVYVRLAAPVGAARLQSLNRRLVAYLHADASPSALNGYLRPPGTFNHKPEALGTGPAAPVCVAADYPGAGWEPAELEQLLPPERARQDALDLYANLEAVPLPADLPLSVRIILADRADWTGDRSARLFALICAAARGHLSEAQALTCAMAHRPSQAKYGDRLAAEAARVIAKLGRAGR